MKKPEDDAVTDRLTPLVLAAVGEIPKARTRRVHDPDAAAQELARKAALKAALVAGALALPTGPLGWLTLLPELRSVWRIQVQLVADIAALYGRKTALDEAKVLYCLFRHNGVRALQDLLLRVGDRAAVGAVPARVLQLAARKVAASLARRLAGRGVSRWLPVAGAVGLGAYAYYETARVGATARELFAAEVVES